MQLHIPGGVTIAAESEFPHRADYTTSWNFVRSPRNSPVANRPLSSPFPSSLPLSASLPRRSMLNSAFILSRIKFRLKARKKPVLSRRNSMHSLWSFTLWNLNCMLPCTPKNWKTSAIPRAKVKQKYRTKNSPTGNWKKECVFSCQAKSCRIKIFPRGSVVGKISLGDWWIGNASSQRAIARKQQERGDSR